MNANRVAYINLYLTADQQRFFKSDMEAEMDLYNNNRRHQPYFFKPYGADLRQDTARVIKTIKDRYKEYKASEDTRATRIREYRARLHNGDITAVSNLTSEYHPFNVDDLNAIRRIMGNNKWVLKAHLIDPFTGLATAVQYITVSNRSWPDIKKLLKTYSKAIAREGIGSDAIGNIVISDVSKIEFKRINRPARMLPNNQRAQKNGRFFPYVNKSNIDMTRYQIISSPDQIELTKEHCIIYALRLLGESKEKLNAITSAFVEGANIAKKELYTIADIIGKNIMLSQYEREGSVRNLMFPKDAHYAETHNLALFENHYFIQEPTIYTMFSIKNYRDLEDEPNNHNIVKIKKGIPETSKNAKRIESLQMIYMMMKNEYFEFEDYVSTLDNAVKVDMCDPLDVDLTNDNNQMLYEYKEKKPRSNNVFFADTESFVSNGQHSPLMMGIMKSNDKKPHISVTTIKEGKNTGSCVFDMLKYAVTNSGDGDITIYFHNLKYDFNVIKQYIHVLDTGICEKDGQLYSVKILYKSKIISLLDSYKMAGFKLADFQGSFDLPEEMNKKEAIGYSYYTFDNYMKRARICDYVEHVKAKDYQTFVLGVHYMENAKVDLNDGTFDALEYYKEYLKYDVLVLCEGMKKMRSALKKITDLDMYDYYTISSISDAYVKKNGAYDGVYGMRGDLRRFGAQNVTGGRVHVNETYKKVIIEEEINDYDAVSLYPSAIVRLCRERGIPMGKAKKLETLDYETIKSYSYAMLKVRINKINKRQQMPMIHKKNDDGTIDYVNESESFVTVIDIYQLDDYIKYHEIEYEILGGIYYNDGFNKKMGDLVEHLFNARLKYKKEKNESLQLCCKLMMNSIYGRSIMKQSKENIVVVENNDKMEEYIYSNFSTITEWEKLNDRQYKVYHDKSDLTYNYSQVGCSILSYSKRIVNEVMDVANNNNINIYYTDTDSLHIINSGIPKLESEYKKIHGRDLNGKNLGQFHSDFNIEINELADIKEYNKKADIACTKVTAYKSCFIGKKFYCDMLKGHNWMTGKTEYGHHVRIKGVTAAGINHKIKEYDNDVFKIFKNMTDGNEETFLLNPGDYCLFEYSTTGVITKKDPFFRTLNRLKQE